LTDLIDKGTFIRSGQDNVDLKINVFEEGRIDDDIQRENLLLEKLNELDKLAPAQRQLHHQSGRSLTSRSTCLRYSGPYLPKPGAMMIFKSLRPR
jgi:hypothetical protein